MSGFTSNRVCVTSDRRLAHFVTLPQTLATLQLPSGIHLVFEPDQSLSEYTFGVLPSVLFVLCVT
jgi:hypothetical protein